MPNQERLSEVNLSTAFYGDVKVVDRYESNGDCEQKVLISSSLGEYVQGYPLSKYGKDRTERVCQIVRLLGGDNLTTELARAHDFHSLDIANYILENFSDPECVTSEDKTVINSVLALSALKECQATQRRSGEEELEPYFEMAYEFNGGFRRALLVRAAECIDELRRTDQTTFPKDVENELNLYITLLGLVEEQEGVRHIKDLYVEKKYPRYFNLYNQAANIVAGGEQNRREFVHQERQAVERMHNELMARLIAAGLLPVDHAELVSRMNSALEFVNKVFKPSDSQKTLMGILNDREFYISPVREKSIGSLILKAMRYLGNKDFRNIYAQHHEGQEPSLDKIETWKYILCNMTDCHGFRIVLPSKSLQEEVQFFLTNVAFGGLKDVGIKESTFLDPRNEHFIDDKAKAPEGRIDAVNIVLRDPQRVLPFEVQLMTASAYFDYCYGSGNYLSYKQAREARSCCFSPEDVRRAAAAVKKG
ncbi:MAG: hypothetical protein ACOX6V_05360 [Patescibacteria group bacterium]|jgi:hypothetical protein